MTKWTDHICEFWLWVEFYFLEQWLEIQNKQMALLYRNLYLISEQGRHTGKSTLEMLKEEHVENRMVYLKLPGLLSPC